MNLLKSALRGGAAGLAATGVMTGEIYGAKAASLLRTPPPKQISKNVALRAGILPWVHPKEKVTIGWLTAHAGFGLACGLIYGLIEPFMPINRVLRGLLYGETVWATNYLGLLPSLGLYPAPDDDRRSRVAVMIGAHAVYGVSLAQIFARLQPKL